MAIRFVSPILFGDPDEQFGSRTEDGGGAQIAVFGSNECPPKKVRNEAHTKVEHLVRDVVGTRGRAPAANIVAAMLLTVGAGTGGSSSLRVAK